MWFTENPWPVVVICLIVTAIFAARAIQTGLGRNWLLVGLGVLLAVGTYLAEQSIVTPAEEVELRVHEAIDHCIEGDVNSVLGMISEGQPGMRVLAMAGLSMADIHDDMRITDLNVRMTAQNSRAISHFRANGTISAGGVSMTGHATTRWEVTWQQENGEWKIVDITRLHPINGEPMEVLRRSET